MQATLLLVKLILSIDTGIKFPRFSLRSHPTRALHAIWIDLDVGTGAHVPFAALSTGSQIRHRASRRFLVTTVLDLTRWMNFDLAVVLARAVMKTGHIVIARDPSFVLGTHLIT